MTGHNAMIVAARPEVAEAGAKVLMRGGNALRPCTPSNELEPDSEAEPIQVWMESP